MTCTRVGLVTVMLLGGLVQPTWAQKAPAPKPPSNEDCLQCHGDVSATGAGGRSVAVLPERYAASVHGQMGMACVDCHADLAALQEYPHADKLAPAACTSCHEAAVTLYEAGVHAEARRASRGVAAATCKDCHTAHEIRRAEDPTSGTYHLNLPATCGACHGSPEALARGRAGRGNVVSQFQDSIHGRALSRSGLLVAPDCTRCHRAHDVRRKSDPASPVHRTAVPATCGACHEGIERRFRAGAHGTALGRGTRSAPVCSTCHSAHGIRRTDGAVWKQDVLRECGGCHAESARTFRDTFHGQQTRLGYMRVATCADCHGAHDIFGRTDSRSTVSPSRLVGTCRTCHPGANERFVQYDPHADKDNRQRDPALFYASRFMRALLVGVFLFFGLHTALWASRAVGARRAQGSPQAVVPPRSPAARAVEAAPETPPARQASHEGEE